MDYALDKWDCVVTSFFIDTAKNIIAYIEVIQKILKPGGVWVNMGPLLYHFEEMSSDISIELTHEEVRGVILSYGLEFQVSSFPFIPLPKRRTPHRFLYPLLFSSLFILEMERGIQDGRAEKGNVRQQREVNAGGGLQLRLLHCQKTSPDNRVTSCDNQIRCSLYLKVVDSKLEQWGEGESLLLFRCASCQGKIPDDHLLLWNPPPLPLILPYPSYPLSPYPI